jgi:hypothetical protein
VFWRESWERTWRRAALALAALIAVLVSSVAAHDVPTDIRINAFVKPAGDRLELLIRVPMAAIQEIEFPLRGQGFIVVSRADEALRNAAKMYLIDNTTITEDDVALSAPRIVAARVSLPSDRSFTSYDRARAHMDASPLADNLDLTWDQQLMDVLLEYPIRSDRSDFAIHPRVDTFGRTVSTAVVFLPPGGPARGYELLGDPGLVRLDPRWHQAALRFVIDGFWHILSGTDHLLFLCCLVVPFRRLRPLVVIVTAFTIGHSISLMASAFGFVPDALWFPPLVETLIAVTILLMGLENIVQAATDKVGGDVARRWIVAFAFGIVHGFGFSFALRESLQFAGDHLLTALFGFNLGVEIGQLAVLLVLVPALGLLFRFVVPEKLGIIILSALIVHTAWHWMIERGELLTRFPFPTIDAAFLASLMRGLLAVLILAAGVWIVHGSITRLLYKSSDTTSDIDKRTRSA